MATQSLSNKEHSSTVKRKNGGKDCVPFARGFKPKTLKEQLQAIGVFNKLPEEYDPRTVLSDSSSSSSDMKYFPAIPSPSSIDDWLAQYNEDGQTYQEFLNECPWLSTRKRKNMSSKTFVSSGNTILYKYPDRKIYLMPVGNFDSSSSSVTPNFDDLIDYAQRFLCLPVVKTDGAKLDLNNKSTVYWINKPETSSSDSKQRRSMRTKNVTLTSRYNKQSGHLQLCVDSQLLKLRQLIPADAICLMGLTMYDLYAEDPDLFVAGMAAGNNRVGIFSFFRYNPAISFSAENWYEIFNSDNSATLSLSEVRRLMLERSCKLLVHELCHLLGIDHCVYFTCCMNGSGHLQEDFRQPMHLCPVDLHKLQTLVGFDIMERYEGLLEFYEKHNMQDEAVWVKNRIQFIIDKKANS